MTETATKRHGQTIRDILNAQDSLFFFQRLPREQRRQLEEIANFLQVEEKFYVRINAHDRVESIDCAWGPFEGETEAENWLHDFHDRLIFERWTVECKVFCTNDKTMFNEIRPPSELRHGVIESSPLDLLLYDQSDVN